MVADWLNSIRNIFLSGNASGRFVIPFPSPIFRAAKWKGEKQRKKTETFIRLGWMVIAYRTHIGWWKWNYAKLAPQKYPQGIIYPN
jgi:hypothetical protein